MDPNYTFFVTADGCLTTVELEASGHNAAAAQALLATADIVRDHALRGATLKRLTVKAMTSAGESVFEARLDVSHQAPLAEEDGRVWLDA
ncbi:hypothetical protein [Brevundimonas sp. CEF1]|jgi:hypothetical protein|uniref:hypothetical protein n=1 Tax=Brevundimonas sp. CEF1 TaxID=3442642 RepID=UPI003F515F3B